MTRLVLLCAALVAGLLLAGLSRCKAHDAPTGWTYDAACCSGQDCAPLPEGSVSERADGYLLRETGEVVERAKSRQGQDENYHLCRSAYSKTIYCIYLPMRGV